MLANRATSGCQLRLSRAAARNQVLVDFDGTITPADPADRCGL